MRLNCILIHMPKLESGASSTWYHPTIVTKMGKRLTDRRNPEDSTQVEDLELLTILTGSRAFAREFLQVNGSASKLTELESPRDLLRYPSATSGVIARAWMALEFAARLMNREVVAS